MLTALEIVTVILVAGVVVRAPAIGRRLYLLYPGR
jgi:hypothetical protein